MSENETDNEPNSDGCANTGCAVIGVFLFVGFMFGSCSKSSEVTVSHRETAEKHQSQHPLAVTPEETPTNEDDSPTEPKAPSGLEVASSDLEVYLREHPRPNLPATSRRFWVDSTGAHGVDGVVEDVAADSVAIKKDDGKVVKVPRSKLATLDQRFLVESFSEYLRVLQDWTEKHNALHSRLQLAQESERKAKVDSAVSIEQKPSTAKTPPESRPSIKTDLRENLDEDVEAMQRLLSQSSQVRGLRARVISGSIKQLTVTVDNLWIIKHKQVRLQDAQNLQSLWASVANPSEPDSAPITIVDSNGNTLGGSRWIGGTVVYVDD